MGWLAPALEGSSLGASLIIAIGAQNAFVLRQGLIGQHVFAVAMFCALSDALLIALGVAGFGTVVRQSPVLIEIVRWGGAAFLFWYGLSAFRRALHPRSLIAGAAPEAIRPGPALAQCAALTWANPHVYLDTVVLLGGLSATHQGGARLAFGLGAAASSFAWFFALAYGARLLQPLFAKPAAWRALDIVIGCVMWLIAWQVLAMG